MSKLLIKREVLYIDDCRVAVRLAVGTAKGIGVAHTLVLSSARSRRETRGVARKTPRAARIGLVDFGDVAQGETLMKRVSE